MPPRSLASPHDEPARKPLFRGTSRAASKCRSLLTDRTPGAFPWAERSNSSPFFLPPKFPEKSPPQRNSPHELSLGEFPNVCPQAKGPDIFFAIRRSVPLARPTPGKLLRRPEPLSRHKQKTALPGGLEPLLLTIPATRTATPVVAPCDAVWLPDPSVPRIHQDFGNILGTTFVVAPHGGVSIPYSSGQ